MTLVHSCRKHKFLKGFCCWLYQALNGVDEGKAGMGEGGRDEEVASSKTNRIEDSECKNGYPIYDQNG